MLVKRLTAPAFLVGFLLLGVGACSDNPCEEWGDEVCALACECADGDGCAFAAGGVTLSFDSESDCHGFFSTQFACRDGGEPEFDYEGCTAQLDQAMCVETPDGVGAVQLPPCAE